MRYNNRELMRWDKKIAGDIAGRLLVLEHELTTYPLEYSYPEVFESMDMWVSVVKRIRSGFERYDVIVKDKEEFNEVFNLFRVYFNNLWC